MNYYEYIIEKVVSKHCTMRGTTRRLLGQELIFPVGRRTHSYVFQVVEIGTENFNFAMRLNEDVCTSEECI